MLVPDESYEKVTFAGTQFDTPAAGNCHFLECTFDHCSFGQNKILRSRFTDCVLREVRFIAVDAAETAWQDSTLTGCALAGMQAYSAQLRRVCFRNCKLDSVNFRTSALIDVRFEDCLLRDVDFGSATLKRVRFPGCTLTGADFTKVTCTDVDLRGAGLGISRGFGALNGARIDTVQLVALAPLLAEHLGIKVSD
jgi:uncharacterized protein YjbI with pentapeptide repeats